MTLNLTTSLRAAEDNTMFIAAIPPTHSPDNGRSDENAEQHHDRAAGGVADQPSISVLNRRSFVMNMMTSAAAIAAATPIVDARAGQSAIQIMISPRDEGSDTAATADPIFAAMDAYRAAHTRSDELIDEASAIETRLHKLATERGAAKAPPGVDPDQLWPRYGYPELRLLDGSPDYLKKQELDEESSDLLIDAALSFAETIPTTDAGAVAMLGFIQERHHEGDIVGGDYTDSDEPLEHMVMASVATYLRSKLS